MATGTLKNTQKIPFSLLPKDADGTPRSIENFETEALNDADLTFEEAPDGPNGEINGFVVSGDTIGSFQIKFKGDAKIGAGEVILEEIHDIIVEAAEATTLGGTFGTPVPK